MIPTLLSPLTQNPLYHSFADGRTIAGVPNFWNVVSNAAFVLVALYGLLALRSRTAFIETWERWAYGLLLLGTLGVAAGSAYYHWQPSNDRLFWDRLPMAIVFTSLIASTIGERVSSRAGRLLLVPLLVLGVGSVVEWRWTGDLRLYGLVQFGAMAAVAVMVLRFAPKYTEERGIWLLGLFYGLAKVLELGDQAIGDVVATGGHPWKHVCAAVGMGFYVRAVIKRGPLPGGRGSEG